VNRLAALGGDQPALVLVGDDARGIDDGFQRVLAFEAAGEGGQIGPEAAADLLEAVAFGTARFFIDLAAGLHRAFTAVSFQEHQQLIVGPAGSRLLAVHDWAARQGRVSWPLVQRGFPVAFFGVRCSSRRVAEEVINGAPVAEPAVPVLGDFEPGEVADPLGGSPTLGHGREATGVVNGVGPNCKVLRLAEFFHCVQHFVDAAWHAQGR